MYLLIPKAKNQKARACPIIWPQAVMYALVHSCETALQQPLVFRANSASTEPSRYRPTLAKLWQQCLLQWRENSQAWNKSEQNKSCPTQGPRGQKMTRNSRRWRLERRTQVESCVARGRRPQLRNTMTNQPWTLASGLPVNQAASALVDNVQRTRHHFPPSIIPHLRTEQRPWVWPGSVGDASCLILQFSLHSVGFIQYLLFWVSVKTKH